jgi:hypothetical protein
MFLGWWLNCDEYNVSSIQNKCRSNLAGTPLSQQCYFPRSFLIFKLFYWCVFTCNISHIWCSFKGYFQWLFVDSQGFFPWDSAFLSWYVSSILRLSRILKLTFPSKFPSDGASLHWTEIPGATQWLSFQLGSACSYRSCSHVRTPIYHCPRSFNSFLFLQFRKVLFNKELIQTLWLNKTRWYKYKCQRLQIS